MTWTRIASMHRSLLEHNIWYADYGPDQSCFQYPGHQRAVKAHINESSPDLDDPFIVPGTKPRWVRIDDSCWELQVNVRDPEPDPPRSMRF